MPGNPQASSQPKVHFFSEIFKGKCDFVDNCSISSLISIPINDTNQECRNQDASQIQNIYSESWLTNLFTLYPNYAWLIFAVLCFVDFLAMTHMKIWISNG